MRTFFWAVLLGAANAVPASKSKEVATIAAGNAEVTIGTDANAIIIEPGSGEVNIVINQVVATVTAPAPCAGTANIATEIDGTVRTQAYQVGGTVKTETTQVASTVINSKTKSTEADYTIKTKNTYTASTATATATQSLNPPSTLLPTQPGLPEHAHPSACAPQSSLTLYYGAAATTGLANAAQLIISELTYPAVNAHVADTIESVVCQGSSATVKFTTSAAYNVAVATWGKNGLFQILTFSDTCGTGTANGQHDFILVDGVKDHETDKLTLVCSITIIDFEHAVGAETEMDILLGNPASSSGNNSTGGSSSSSSTAFASSTGGPPSSNGTSSISSNSTSPSNSTSSGRIQVPPSCSGGSFDADLDSSLGATLDLSNPDTWSQVLGDTDATDWDGDYSTEDLPDIYHKKRNLNRRELMLRAVQRRGLWERAKALWNKHPLAPVIQRHIDLAKAFNGFTLAEKTAGLALGLYDLWQNQDKDIPSVLEFKKFPTSPDGTSEFGEGFKIYGNGGLDVYCVKCGVQGYLNVKARMRVSLRGGFHQGFVNVGGFLQATTNIGVVGSIQKTFPIKDKSLLFYTVGDVLVPGVLKLGPHIRVAAGASLSVEASGSMLAGVMLTWSQIDFLVDFKDNSKSGLGGLAPVPATRFEASGAIEATLDGHLTIGVGVAIGLFSETFSLKLEAIDQPGVQVTAGIQGSAQFNNGFSSKFTGTCKGVSMAAYVYNNVSAKVDRFATYPISSYQSPDFWSRCFGGTSSSGMDFEPNEPPTNNNPNDADEPDVQDSTEDTGDNSTTDTDGFEDGMDQSDPFENSKRHLERHVMKRNVAVHPHGSHVRRQLSNNRRAVTNTTKAAGEFSPADAIYSVIVSDNNRWEVHWSQNGNLYVIPSNGDTDSADADPNDSDIETADITGLFGTTPLTNKNATEKPYIISDSDGRLLHGYVDEFSNYGVSRLRLHHADVLPTTSMAIAFSAATNSDDGSLDMIGFDTAGNQYFPIMCVYADCYPKLFLATDPFDGATMLQNLTEITGEANLTCAYIALNGNGNHNGI